MVNANRQVNTYTVEELEELIKVMKNFDEQDAKLVQRMDVTTGPKTKGTIRMIDGVTYYQSTNVTDSQYNYFER